ncbi:aminotransferase class I/II-fold pyridoxal phosphate-dependent enzyme [Fulvimarina endophytica]|uniref:histidinol-phosphate transaminase n=2 Tax=Fulvimarina endophytica TaxID=2293836 RepID=A0A371XBI1_9HYPH|nr:aminotransferase class I/II-fold pyridoxal phosphate-dependent enzyme [Fulvimarina endophytica]
MRGGAFTARLGANESVFGPSPKVIEAVGRAAADGWMYGDPEQFELREALAEHLGLAVGNILCGTGIDGLLRDLVAACCEPGDSVLASLGSYPTFTYFAGAAGVRVETVPYQSDFRQDLQALAESAERIRPRILYLTNPDNPTGSYWQASDIETLIERVPEETLIALDEAYCEFAPASAMLEAGFIRPNLLRFRTFSKAYGMAGFRLGYVFGDPGDIRQFNKIRDHFSLSRLAQVAGIAALADQDHLRTVLDLVADGRERLTRAAERHGLTPLPSAANFVAMAVAGDAQYTGELAERIEASGVFIRRPRAKGLDNLLRISVGTASDAQVFEDALERALHHREA